MRVSSRTERCWVWPCLLASLLSFGSLSTSLAAEEDPLADEKLPSLWIKSVDAQVSSGYKDNVLLSSEHIVSSPFLAGGVDLTFMRIPLNEWEFLWFSSAEYTRYLDAPQVDQEAMVVAQLQAKRSFPDGWKAGLSAEYVYFDQVFDNSTVSLQLVALPIDGHGFTVRPNVLKEFGRGYRLELELPATRQIFGEFIDNYWEAGPKLIFTRELARKSEFSAIYQFNDRMHDTRSARARDGTPLEESLQFYQHEVSAAWRQTWDQPAHWRTTLRLSLQRNEDNGGGFYDYLRPLVSAQLRYREKTWEVRTEARFSYYQYDHQAIGGADSPVRHKAYVRFNLRGEKQLAKSWKLFGQYEHESSLSNLRLDEYDVNTVSAGVAVEF